MCVWALIIITMYLQFFSSSPLSCACRSCSRSWSSWRCRRSTSKMNRRTWRKSSSMPRRRWRGYRASRWSLDSFLKLLTRTLPSLVPQQVTLAKNSVVLNFYWHAGRLFWTLPTVIVLYLSRLQIQHQQDVVQIKSLELSSQVTYKPFQDIFFHLVTLQKVKMNLMHF